MEKSYSYHIDNGHGWVVVPHEELKSLGIADKISSCSMRLSKICYLEEDCDLKIWQDAFIAKHNQKPVFCEIYHDEKECFVRYLPQYFN